MNRLIYLLIFVIIFLNSCSTTFLRKGNNNTYPPNWYLYREKIRSLKHYQASGEIVYISNKYNIYFKFLWQKNFSNCFSLLLINPFTGKTELILNINSKMIQLNYNKYNKCYINNKNNNIEANLSKIIGVNIPFNNLQQWIIGLPGDADCIYFDNKSRIYKMIYMKNSKIWNILYSKYDDFIIPALPKQLELTEGKQLIKIIINNWTI